MAKPSESADAEIVEIALRARDRAAAERALAEAYAAGAIGCEERDESDGVTFLLYAPRARAAAVRAAVLAALGTGADAELGLPRALPAVDWSEAWKAELVPIAISSRLAVRPSCAAFDPAPGQRVLVVDPAQAFGTGAHESTRLALEWIAELAPDLRPGARVLDLGTGTGVLALAALALAPVRAFALDLDPLAAPEARANARRNGLADRLCVWTGGIESLAPENGFELAVANLLRRELEPVLADLARRLRPGGRLVLSGLLADERPRVEALARESGLRIAGIRERDDASGVRWVALLTTRPREPASPPGRGAA